MKVLLTGSTGFLGREIIEYLLSNGHEVVGLHQNRAVQPISQINPMYTEIISDLGSINNIRYVYNCSDRCDAIIHTAASLSMDLYAAEISRVNCTGLQNILWLASQWRVNRFIFLSSLPVIGTPRFLPITEDHPAEPNTAYHLSKLFGEQIIKLAARKGLSHIIMRITAPVGPKMPSNRLLSVLTHNAVKGLPLVINGLGYRRQNYIDVRDVARAVVCCIEKSSEGIYNIAANSSISNLELAKLCISRCGSASIIKFNTTEDPEDDVKWDVSNEKARTQLGFEPIYSIIDTIDSIKEYLVSVRF